MANDLLTDEEARRIKEFKALYYEFNAKPDTTTKIFEQKVVVSMDDLQNLEEMIKEKLSLHSKDGQFGKSYVNVATSKHKMYSFDDWKCFLQNNWKIPETIESITLIWDFYIVVEGYKNPQRHKLTVKISAGLKPEEVLNLILSGKVEDMQEFEAKQAPIIAQMDFIENRLGQEFLNIVEDWVGTLESLMSNKSTLMLFFKSQRKAIGYYLNYLLFFAFTFMCLAGLNFFTASFKLNSLADITMKQFNAILNYIIICCIIAFVILNIGENVANKVFRKLSEYGNSFTFRITKGDDVKYNKLQKQDEKNAIKIAANLIFSLLLNILCGIIASVAYSHL